MYIPLWSSHIRSHTQRILGTIHTTSRIIKPKPVIHPPRLSILILASKQHRGGHTRPLTPTKQRLGHVSHDTALLSVNQLLRGTSQISHQGIEHRIHLRLRPPRYTGSVIIVGGGEVNLPYQLTRTRILHPHPTRHTRRITHGRVLSHQIMTHIRKHLT